MAQVNGENLDRLLSKISAAVAGEPVADVLAAFIVVSMTYQLGSELTLEQVEESIYKVSNNMSELAEKYYQQNKKDKQLEDLEPVSEAVN